MSNFQDPPPLVYLRPKFLDTLDLGLPISNKSPSSPSDNQSIKRKHDLRMAIICYQQSNYKIIHHPQWLLLTHPLHKKCDQIRRNLQIWSHLLKKSLMENFFFCAVFLVWGIAFLIIFTHLLSHIQIHVYKLLQWCKIPFSYIYIYIYIYLLK